MDGVITDRSADVVAASSLLAVLADGQGGLQNLWSHVDAGDYLLVIEPKDRATNVALYAERSPRSACRG